MTFPPVPEMLILLALATGRGLTVAGPDLFLAMDDGEAEVQTEWLDALETRGQVEVIPDAECGVRITDKGRYCLGRWVQSRMRAAHGPGKYQVSHAAVARAVL